VGGAGVPLRTQAGGAWAWRLLAEDFSAPCREDRFCVPCAAAFCDHCCGEGRHEVVVRVEASATAASSDPRGLRPRPSPARRRGPPAAG